MKSFRQSQNIIREKLRKALSYEKHTRKLLMKLTPGHKDLLDESADFFDQSE
jgi:hypothetical protein